MHFTFESADFVAENYAAKISVQQQYRMVDNARFLTRAVRKIQRMENDCINNHHSLECKQVVKTTAGPKLAREIVWVENKILESLQRSDFGPSPPIGVLFEEGGCTPYTSDSES